MEKVPLWLRVWAICRQTDPAWSGSAIQLPPRMAQLMGTLRLMASRLTLSTYTYTVHNLDLDGNMDVVLI